MMLEADNDDLLQRMKSSRGRPAELKLRLINVRSQAPEAIIFAFEGDEDRSAYFSWVRFIDSSFRYEPLSCGGKSAVLRLKQAVDRDAGNLAHGVYFFIDRDFDDSRGITIDPSIYMTDQYSIENYLVTPSTVDEILKIELNCDGHPQTREQIVKIFEILYDQFLQITRKHNLLLFACRRLGVELEKTLDNPANKIFSVTFDAITDLKLSPHEFIRPSREIDSNEINDIQLQFDELSPRERYRGKFALSFLIKWLEEVSRERRNPESNLFRELQKESRTRVDRISIGTLATRVSPPESLTRFLHENVFPHSL